MSDAELDDLTREIEGLCDRGDWDGLVALRDRCREALKRGKQFWPAASYAEYRLALDAPGPWAAAVVSEQGTGRFALGPLPEVAASSHQWADLSAGEQSPALTMAAHERVVRGEDLRSDTDVDADVLDIPLVLQPWEPAYPVAQYKAGEAHFPAPALPGLDVVTLPAEAPTPVEDLDSRRALVELATAWTTESNGRAEAVAVRGDAAGALAALGLRRQARMAQVTAADALAHMAWTAASGGAHGRRRGMAAGRFGAWWALTAMAGMLDDWPVDPDELGQVAAELRWYLWDAGEPVTGWGLRLAVEDPAEGLAWAVVAQDAD
ncbi:MAG TPA: DUF6183 family protein [Acidimicrobiales bacterium]|nr:DUF6183 family protein [Acidimicrobiales bacterium]